MTLTRDEREALMDLYPDLDTTQAQIVDATMGALAHAGRVSGVKLPGDDRMAKVEAAVIRLVVEASA